MRLLIALVINMALGGQLFSQSNDPLHDIDYALEFINWKIKTDKRNKNIVPVKRVDIQILQWDDLDILKADSSLQIWMDSCHLEFTQSINDDIDTIEVQASSNLQYTGWTKSHLKRVKLISPEAYDSPAFKPYWSYSIPLFSKDKTICIIKVNYFCGFLCEDYRIIAYKLKGDGEWEEICILMHLAS